jgi:hypothetical protein
MKNQKVQYVCKAIKWFDKVNGNTYHSVNITRTSDGKKVYGQFEYGYGDQYRQTALESMEKAGWIPEKYTGKNRYMFERENNYPILWDCSDGLKRDCIANGKE